MLPLRCFVKLFLNFHDSDLLHFHLSRIQSLLINQLKLQQFTFLKQRSRMQSFNVVLMRFLIQSELDNFKFLLQFEIPSQNLALHCFSTCFHSVSLSNFSWTCMTPICCNSIFRAYNRIWSTNWSFNNSLSSSNDRACKASKSLWCGSSSNLNLTT